MKDAIAPNISAASYAKPLNHALAAHPPLAFAHAPVKVLEKPVPITQNASLL